jgi:flagellar hook-associated protein 2
MGSIQSSVGLITGIPIAETIEKLMSLEAAPKDRLSARQTALKTEQTAIVDLTTLVVGLQLTGKGLGRVELFKTKSASVSNSNLLSATVTGAPSLGNYTVNPVRQVQTQQTLSSAIASKTAALGAGTITIGQCGIVDEGVSLDTLNGGQGVQRGKIKVTDRSGATATIDLRFAQTIDDVLIAINSNSDISVNATASGDSIELTDLTGQTSANLRVQEVSGGTTAAGLGLASVNVASSTATGGDIFSLSSSTDVNRLNDGSGLSVRSSVADLQISFRDQSSINVHFNGTEKSLGDVMDRINNVGAGKIEAKISTSGDTIEFKDLTTDAGGTFAVSNANNGSLKEDLGLVNAASGDTITGDRLLGGLKTSLLRSLGGGHGLGTLGSIAITDRSGASATVDLSSAKTLEGIISAINGAGLGVTASINDARNGIVLNDTTGSSASNLIVANDDPTNTATKLKIAVNGAVTKVNSASLAKQFVSESTQLSTLNGGDGVTLGKILVQDGVGASSVLDLDTLDVETIGDVIDAFNSLSIGVRAKINDAGDGLLVYDTTGGGANVIISDVGGNKTAEDLHLTGTSALTIVNASSVQAVNGSTTLSVTLDADDSLEDLVEKLNDAGAGVTAKIIASSANTSQFELAVGANRSGNAGRFVLDLSAIGLTTSTAVEGRDALAAVTQSTGGAARLYTSTDNNFASAIEGVSFTLKGNSTDAISISVTQSNSGVQGALQQFVDQYNKIRDKLISLDFFNEDTQQRGALFGSSTALRINSGLSKLVTDRYSGLGDISALTALGVGITENGKLTLDATKLQQRLAQDPDDVENFFTHATRGFAKKLDDLTEQLAGVKNASLLLGRNTTLQEQIDAFQIRIDTMTARLDRRKTALQLKFYNLELAVQKIQSNQSSITTLQNVAASLVS